MISPELLFILIAILVIVVFLVLVTFFIGVIFYNAIRESKVNLKSWSETAETLGLQMPDPKDFRLEGKYNDLEVLIKTESKIVRMYTRTESYQFTGCLVKFPKSLKLSLDLKYPKDLAKDLVSNSLTIGQTEFDTNFDVACNNPKVLQELLFSNADTKTNKKLLDDLLQTINYIETASYKPAMIKVRHKETDPAFVITDDALLIKFRTQFGDDVGKIKQLLDVTTYLAQRFYLASQNVFPTEL